MSESAEAAFFLRYNALHMQTALPCAAILQLSTRTLSGTHTYLSCVRPAMQTFGSIARWETGLEAPHARARTADMGPRGVAVSTLDSESSDRGSKPREVYVLHGR